MTIGSLHSLQEKLQNVGIRLKIISIMDMNRYFRRAEGRHNIQLKRSVIFLAYLVSKDYHVGF